MLGYSRARIMLGYSRARIMLGLGLCWGILGLETSQDSPKSLRNPGMLHERW